jgi:hypothetical protein
MTAVEPVGLSTKERTDTWVIADTVGVLQGGLVLRIRNAGRNTRREVKRSSALCARRCEAIEESR